MTSIKYENNILLLFTIIIYYNLFLIDCVIPALTVKKVNSKVIERKRLDNLEICRLFNEENKRQRLDIKTNNIRGTGDTSYPRHRMKRDVHSSNKVDNPVLKKEDILRVEKIVEKLYDDLEEDGNHIVYRQRNVNNVTKSIKNKINRRFNFAPAELYGPVGEKTEPIQKLQDVGKLPWIKKWKHGIVPYFIDPNTYEIILNAFDYIEKVTCIRLQRLREKPVDKQSMQSVEWLYITNPSGIKQCVHSNERIPNTGVQMVILGYHCLSLGEIAHEIMHVLGFSHEHTRSDRDRYITILWDNIKPGYKKYFKTRPDDRLLYLPYDYASVLHYPPRAFTRNGQITVMADTGNKIGQRKSLSELDVEKIGIIYGHECVARNKDYLLKTCPSVVKTNPEPVAVTTRDVEEYFKDRIWPYGIVNYQIKNKLEFTPEERENMKAVFHHIEKETCIEFRDINEKDEDDDGNSNQSTTPTNDQISSKENETNTIRISDITKVTPPGNVENEIDSVSGTHTTNTIRIFNLTEVTSKGNIEDEETTTKTQSTIIIFNVNDVTSQGNVEVNDTEASMKTPSTIKISNFKEVTSKGNMDIDDKEDSIKTQSTIKMFDLNEVKAPGNVKANNEEASMKKASTIKIFDLNEVKPPGNAEVNGEEAKIKTPSTIRLQNINQLTPPNNKNIVRKFINRKKLRSNRNNIVRYGTPKTNNKKIYNHHSYKSQKAKQKSDSKKIIRPKSPARRHAENVMMLARSSEPGCRCPPAGRPNGNKELIINADCFNSVNDLLHLFVHVLGLDHQHNMHDRESFLHIVWNNLTFEVREEMKDTLPPAASAGFAYDYQSVTHYPWLQIKDGVTNIMYPIWNDGWAMGHWQGLSSTDVQKISLIYKDECKKRKQHTRNDASEI